MFKIRPPQGEFRWVMGQHLIPARKNLRGKFDKTDPFSPPKKQDYEPPIAKKDDNPFKKPSELTAGNSNKKKTDTGNPFVRRGPTSEELATIRNQMKQIDSQFREMLEVTKPDNWELSDLGVSYRQLKNMTSSSSLKKQLDMRLEAVARYERIQHEYTDFVKLTLETSRRDAQLLSIQKKNGEKKKSPGIELPKRDSTSVIAPSPQSPTQPKPAVPTAKKKSSRFDGAGIVQRSATTYAGAPRHVLLAPNGRILAYLLPTQGMNLDQFVGKSVGVVGKRSYQANLQTDFILVRSLVPVQLRVPAQGR